MYDLGLVNGKLYIDGKFENKNLYIKGEKIAAISSDIFPCKESIDVKGKSILPGFIDSHVHFKLNLGEFESADDFESGSISAAFGGITTFIDFLDPIFTNAEFPSRFEKRLSLASSSYVDYSFHTTLGNYHDDVNKLKDLSLQAGLTSIKVFTTYSESNRRCDINVIESLLNTPLTILSHTENDELVDSTWKTVYDYESSRPVISENTEAMHLAALVKKTGGKLYIVHTSAGSTIEKLNKSYPEILGKHLFLESCPHYFNLSKDNFTLNNGRLYLLAPPLRSNEEKNRLKENFNLINTIGTDHCPFTIEEKYRYEDADKVPKGIGSIEFSFVLMYSLFGDRIIDKFTKNPAKIFGLENKGTLHIGTDADIAIFNPNGKTVITNGHSKSDYSPYEGYEVKGTVESTIIRGNFVVKNKKLFKTKGKFIRRSL
ncbi:MAG: amidohydrolase family protein [Clostridiales bacterium]|nr:amidohydrolase family protein [Clostridiales bacterium]